MMIFGYRCRILGGVEILQNRRKSVSPVDCTFLAVLEQPARTQTCWGYPRSLICGVARLLTPTNEKVTVDNPSDFAKKIPIAKEFT